MKKPFEFPKQILDSINECSGGGFVLFTINDMGVPCVYHGFDNEITALGLRKFALDYLANMERVEEDAGCAVLRKAFGIKRDEEPEDEEDEEIF